MCTSLLSVALCSLLSALLSLVTLCSHLSGFSAVPSLFVLYSSVPRCPMLFLSLSALSRSPNVTFSQFLRRAFLCPRPSPLPLNAELTFSFLAFELP
jgi:hypothetical protein